MRIKPGFVLREVAGEAVVLPVAERVVDFKGLGMLSPSARLLWERLVVGCGEEELVDALTDRFDVAPEQARNDVREFLDELTMRGMVIDA